MSEMVSVVAEKTVTIRMQDWQKIHLKYRAKEAGMTIPEFTRTLINEGWKQRQIKGVSPLPEILRGQMATLRESSLKKARGES